MFGDMALRHMPNSGHGGPHMTPFMTILVFYVSPPIPKIEKFQAYEVYKYREVFHQILYQIYFRMPPESCLETNFRPQLLPYL